MAKIDFKENGSKGVESSKDGAQGCERIIFSGYSPATALLQMVGKFGAQLSLKDLYSLDIEKWYLNTTIEHWQQLAENLSVLISEDNNKEARAGMYSTNSDDVPNLLLMMSRAFNEIHSLIMLNEIVEERIKELEAQ
jgi:hypothetical protein